MLKFRVNLKKEKKTKTKLIVEMHKTWKKPLHKRKVVSSILPPFFLPFSLVWKVTPLVLAVGDNLLAGSLGLLHASADGESVRYLDAAVTISNATQMHLHVWHALLYTAPGSISPDGTWPVLCHLSVCRRAAFRY